MKIYLKKQVCCAKKRNQALITDFFASKHMNTQLKSFLKEMGGHLPIVAFVSRLLFAILIWGCVLGAKSASYEGMDSCTSPGSCGMEGGCSINHAIRHSLNVK